MNIHQQVPSQALRTLGSAQHANLSRIHAVLVAAVLSGSAYAQNDLNAIGGGGGGAFRSSCAPDQMLSGFELRTGDYVDALKPLCVTATAPNQAGAASDGPWHGGAGGGLTRVVCPGDMPIVTGMFVGTDSGEAVVNNILLYCNVAAGMKASSDATSSFARPGPAGSISATQDDTQACPMGQVATGVHGRSGLYLDAVGLICAAPRLASTEADRPVIKSIGRVDTTPAPGPRRPICDAARDARARNSPAAPNLEVQCLASKTPVKSLGKANTGIPSTPGPPMSLCERARDARARNSPAAPNLEAQCRAMPPAPAPSATEASPAEVVAPGSDPTPPSKRTQRDAMIQALAEIIASRNNGSRADPASSAANADGILPGERVTGNRQDRYPTDSASGRRRVTEAKPSASVQAMLQPERSIHVEVWYPATYGYKDSSGVLDPGPNSCSAFFISLLPAAGPRPTELIRIDTQPRMRESSGTYACDYLIPNLPFEQMYLVRVAMSDQRAAGSEAWLGGSQPQPPAGQRRTILDDTRQVQLTTEIPKTTLRFQMTYTGLP